MLIAKNIVKKFDIGGSEAIILKRIDFSVETGEFVAIIGRSGAGKSTLMYILSLLDQPSEGQVKIDGIDIEKLKNQEAADFRLNNFGFIFQEYALLPELTALENVALPLLMRGEKKQIAYDVSTKALEEVGLFNKLSNLPSQLSGGEQQRVSIARAVAHNPKIIFADEPTANLDSERACEIMDIFIRLNHSGQTIIMVTHELEYAESTHRIVELRDGLIIKDERILNPKESVCQRYR